MRSIKHLLIAAVILPAYSYAQDIIVMRDGSIVQSKVTEITSSEVKYKKYSNLDGPLYTIDKSAILAINYENGEKETFAAEEQAPTKVAPTEVMSDEVSEEAMAENKRCIERVNGLSPECTNDKKGKADYIFCTFAVSENSQLINDEMSLDFEWGHVDYLTSANNPTYVSNYSDSEHAMVAVVKNLTEKTIYIDLGNSFFIRGDQASAYYTPSATTVSNTSGSGVGVNAGAVAGALGIGGSVGKLASGINVGGGSSSTTTNVTYSQRVIAIPPMSSKKLDYQFLFDGYSCNGLVVSRPSKHRPLYTTFTFKDEKGKKYDYQVGETHSYSEENAPLRFSLVLSYSYTEHCSLTKSMKVNMYSEQILGFKRSNWDGKMFIDFHGCWGFYASVWKIFQDSRGRQLSIGSFPRP